MFREKHDWGSQRSVPLSCTKLLSMNSSTHQTQCDAVPALTNKLTNS